MTPLEQLSNHLDTREARVRDFQARYEGYSPFIFLTQSQRDALDDRLKSFRVPVEGLAVDVLNERLRLNGFTVNGAPDVDLWERWEDFAGPETQELVQRDALVTGTGYASVWADDQGQPIAVAESARQTIVRRDPLTRRPLLGFKRWTGDDKLGHGIFATPTAIQILQSVSTVSEVSTVPGDGWQVVQTIPNPFGVIPFVPITNPGSAHEVWGRSEVAALADISDAIRKVLIDGLLTSHESGQPRRWATGVQIDVDDDGDAIDPWSNGTATVQSEDPGSKFGQFSAADMAGYQVLDDMLTRKFSALSGVPPQILGANLAAITSADSQRAAEATLTAKAESRIRAFSRGWAQVAGLLVAIRDGSNPARLKVTPTWADPSTNSQAQEADAAVKLNAQGLLSRAATLRYLGFTDAQIDADARQANAEAAQRLALSSLGGAA